jgi:hypothetical protein
MCENVRVSVKRGFQRKLLREKEQMERWVSIWFWSSVPFPPSQLAHGFCIKESATDSEIYFCLNTNADLWETSMLLGQGSMKCQNSENLMSVSWKMIQFNLSLVLCQEVKTVYRECRDVFPAKPFGL